MTSPNQVTDRHRSRGHLAPHQAVSDGEIELAIHNGLTCGSRVEQDALAEEEKAGAAEHLAFEHPDSVDVSFDHARAPWQGEADDHGVAVAAMPAASVWRPGRSSRRTASSHCGNRSPWRSVSICPKDRT